MNPFEWYANRKPTVFAQDPAFAGKSNGKTTSQMATEKVDAQRKDGKSPGTIAGLGKADDKYATYREHNIGADPRKLLAVPTSRPSRARSAGAKAKAGGS